MLRRSSLPLLALLTASGCASQVEVVVPKEVYVEVPGRTGDEDLGREILAFPLEPEMEPRVYAVVRAIPDEPGATARLLARMLGQDEPPPPGAPGAGQPPRAPDGPGPEADLSGLAPDEVPNLFFSPGDVRDRATSATYLGHAAYAGQGGMRGTLLHHLRLVVVNRLTKPVVLRADQVVCVGPEKPRSRTDFTFLAAADEDGFALEELVVAPGEVRTAHLFYGADWMPPWLRVGWTLEEQVDPEVGEGRRYPLEALLIRRFVLPQGRLTDLEARLALGHLPEAAPSLLWREPRLEAVGGGQ